MINAFVRANDASVFQISGWLVVLEVRRQRIDLAGRNIFVCASTTFDHQQPSDDQLRQYSR